MYKVPDNPFSNAKDVLDKMEALSFETKSDKSNPMSASRAVISDALIVLAREIEELKHQKG